MHKSFWFGLIGGVFGVLAALLLIFIGSYVEELGGSSEGIYTFAAITVLFSVSGIVGGLLESKKMVGGALMIISGILVVACVGLLGLLTFLLFIIGGILLIVDARKEQAMPLYAPLPYQGPPPAYPQATLPVRYCHGCGTPIAEQAQYCAMCGTKLQNLG